MRVSRAQDIDAPDTDPSEVIDWAVQMLQFDPALEADALVRADRLTRAQLFAFGGLLAAQHHDIPPVTAPLGPTVLGERAPIMDNFTTLAVGTFAAPAVLSCPHAMC